MRRCHWFHVRGIFKSAKSGHKLVRRGLAPPSWNDVGIPRKLLVQAGRCTWHHVLICVFRNKFLPLVPRRILRDRLQPRSIQEHCPRAGCGFCQLRLPGRPKPRRHDVRAQGIQSHSMGEDRGAEDEHEEDAARKRCCHSFQEMGCLWVIEADARRHRKIRASNAQSSDSS